MRNYVLDVVYHTVSEAYSQWAAMSLKPFAEQRAFALETAMHDERQIESHGGWTNPQLQQAYDGLRVQHENNDNHPAVVDALHRYYFWTSRRAYVLQPEEAKVIYYLRIGEDMMAVLTLQLPDPQALGNVFGELRIAEVLWRQMQRETPGAFEVQATGIMGQVANIHYALTAIPVPEVYEVSILSDVWRLEEASFEFIREAVITHGYRRD